MRRALTLTLASVLVMSVVGSTPAAANVSVDSVPTLATDSSGPCFGDGFVCTALPPLEPATPNLALVLSAAIASPPASLSSFAEQSSLTKIVQDARDLRFLSLQTRWAVFVTDQVLGGGDFDVQATIHHVLRQAYLESNDDLRFYSERVRQATTSRDVVRSQLTALRLMQVTDALSAAASAVLVQDIQARQAELQRLDQFTDATHLALQNAMNQRAATLQVMSNIAKSLSDTANAIVNNIRD